MTMVVMAAAVLLVLPAFACPSIPACEVAVQRAPRDPALHRAFGQVLMRAGEHDAALESFRAAVALAPDDPRGHAALGGAFAVMRDFDSAVPELERAVALDPDGAMASLRMLQWVHVGLRQHEAALRTARRMAEHGDVLAMYDLALALDASAPGEAMQWLERAAAAGHAGAAEQLARQE